MRVEDLKNYGKGLMNSVPDPEGLERMARTKEIVKAELKQELGTAGVRVLRLITERLTYSMKKHDWAIIRAHGLNHEVFLEGIIRRIALMKGLVDVLGMERASALQYRLLDKTLYDLMAPLWPSVEDYLACGDFFKSFKEYTGASMAANVSDGLHVVEIVEDSASVFAFNVTYCAWHEVARAFGDPYLCYPSTCYGDEVTIPLALGRAGCYFRRYGTLATGDAVCDFRYEFFPGGG